MKFQSNIDSNAGKRFPSALGTNGTVHLILLLGRAAYLNLCGFRKKILGLKNVQIDYIYFDANYRVYRLVSRLTACINFFSQFSPLN